MLLRFLALVMGLSVVPDARAKSEPALAAPVKVGMRMAGHGSFGRVVFLVGPGVFAHMTQTGDNSLSVFMPGAGAVPGSARGTLNVVSIAGAADVAVLAVAPGSHPVLWQSAGKVVVDVYGPATPPATKAAAAPRPSAAYVAPLAPRTTAYKVPPGPASGAADGTASLREEGLPSSTPPTLIPVTPDPAIGKRPEPPPQQSPPSAVVAALAEVPAAAASIRAPPADASETDEIAASRVAPGAIDGLAVDADAILVPFDRAVSAASFGRGGLAHVIFDDSKPVDLAQLKDDPVFGNARITLLPAATHLTLRLAAGKRLRLLKRPDGWVVVVVAQTAAIDAASVGLSGGVLNIGMPNAAATVVLDDPATGDRLLVGTVRGDGPAVIVPHLSAEFSLLPSWAGVLVAAGSDRLALRASKTGFALGDATGPPLTAVSAGVAEQALADAGMLTRHFDFMPMSTPLRRARLLSDMGAVARTPKLSRFAPRVRAAQDMLALGLAPEAAAVLRVALQDDPDQAQNADALGLLAMADWFAGRGDGAALRAPALGASDEMEFWRALLQPGDGKAAATLAGTWRLVLAYPEPMQRKLLTLAAYAMLRGGQRAAAEALLARVPDAALDPQRAIALRLDGKTDAALAVLDRLADGRDRKFAAAARVDAIELRLASGKMKPADAAAALDKHLYAWRDDTLEANQRMRIAKLRSLAGAWGPALSLLRETEALYPDTRDKVHSEERQVIADFLASSAAAHLPPLDLVALVEENAGLLSEKEASATLAPVLLDKLLALDLPERADPILGKLMAATDAPEAKAGLGARLADLRLDQGDPAGAEAALASSEGGALPPPLVAHRAVLQARALVLEGKTDAALSLLAAQDSPEALELHAGVLEKRNDWRGAEVVLQSLSRASLPADGKLTDAQQDLVLRLASAASEAGDTAYLQHLRSGDAARLTPGPRAELFAALATKPIQALADLPRSGREAVAATRVPAALASYDAH